MKITKVNSFLPVTVRKTKDEQINSTMQYNACAIMAISITRNNKIRSLTFMFAIKRKKDEKSINVIVIKETNKQKNKHTKMGHK